MRLGIFGGSFDPVHNGHLTLARCCRDSARLDEVWLIPTSVQPFKAGGPSASDRDRLEMLRLAVAREAGLTVSTIEIDRGGFSYTVDTLREVARLRPHAELFLLMGADTLADLPNWREPDEVLRLASPLVVHRTGEETPNPGHAQIIEMPRVEISSSNLRSRVAAGDSIDGSTPDDVVRYIRRHGLYQSS